jgi:PAS domain S-box-containing protein
VRFVGVVWCFATAVSCGFAAAAGLHFVLRPEGITPIWPADGVALAILSRCPRRHWLWVLLGFGLALIVANLRAGSPLAADCWYVVANLSEALLAASILTRFGRDQVGFSTVGELVRLLVAAGPVTAITASIAAAPIVYFGFAPSFWHFWRLWFVSDGLGMLIVTPVILSLINPSARRLSHRRVAEAYGILIAATLCGLWIFGGVNSEAVLVFDLPFVITIPLIIWAALRTNLAVTSLVSLVFTAIAVLETVGGRGPFVQRGGSLESVLVSLQVVAMAWSTCGLAISGAVMQHRRSLRLLSEREERFRRLATSSPAAIVETDEAGRCVYISQRWEKITGQSVEDALGQGWAGAIHPEDIPRVRSQWQTACESASDFVSEHRVRRPTGEIRWINVRLTPFRSIDGSLLGHVGIVVDVTDGKCIEEELEDRRRFTALVADLSATLIDVDPEKVDQAVRDALENLSVSLDLDRVSLTERTEDGLHGNLIFGSSRVEPTIRTFARVDELHPWAWRRLNDGETVLIHDLDELPPEAAIDKASWKSRSVKSFMLVPILIGASRMFIFAASTTARPRKWTDEMALRLRVLGETFVNAIVRSRADQELGQSEAMLRKLNAALLRAEDEERRRLAAVLHDDLAQNLFAVVAQLVALRGGKEAGSSGPQLDAIITSLDEALRQTRELTFDLCPPVLYELGLVAAVGKLADQFKHRYGLTSHLDVTGNFQSLDADLASLLYQAVRELFMNVAKHAHATRIYIRLAESAGQLNISVEDDGAGLSAAPDPDNRARSGFGLFNIRERLRSLGGKLEMSSSPGNGCTVQMVLPLPKPI